MASLSGFEVSKSKHLSVTVVAKQANKPANTDFNTIPNFRTTSLNFSG